MKDTPTNMEAVRRQYEEFMKRKNAPKVIEIPSEAIAIKPNKEKISIKEADFVICLHIKGEAL